MRSCSRRRRAWPAPVATWSSPAPTTIPARSSRSARWVSAIRRRQPASCGAGITAATAPPRQRARARAPDRADARPPEGAGLDRRARPGAAEFRSLPRQPAGRRPALLAVQGQPGAARAGGGDHGQRAGTGRASGAPHHPARFGAVARLLPSPALGRRDDGRSGDRTGARRSRAGHPRPGAPLGQRPALPDRRPAAQAHRAARRRRASPIPTSPPPPSRRCATESSSASPKPMAASAASAWPCSVSASSAAGRCRLPPTST